MQQQYGRAVFQRIDLLELPLCLTLNRTCRHQCIKRFFAIVSRLGDGIFWYTLLVFVLAVQGAQAAYPVLQITITALIGVQIYKILKQRLVRERPYFSNHSIECGTLPLDRYSFPSGHTLHAVSFSVMLIAYNPLFIWIVLPFSVLAAISRIVLGLHYPSDVLAGGLLGLTISITSYQVLPF